MRAWDFSDHGLGRYRVAGGFVTTNLRFVQHILAKSAITKRSRCLVGNFFDYLFFPVTKRQIVTPAIAILKFVRYINILGTPGTESYKIVSRHYKGKTVKSLYVYAMWIIGNGEVHLQHFYKTKSQAKAFNPTGASEDFTD
ncbi:hypothetical protein [Levilactobacillus yonginensis]